jgi:hypothetical protein
MKTFKEYIKSVTLEENVTYNEINESLVVKGWDNIKSFLRRKFTSRNFRHMDSTLFTFNHWVTNVNFKISNIDLGKDFGEKDCFVDVNGFVSGDAIILDTKTFPNVFDTLTQQDLGQYSPLGEVLEWLNHNKATGRVHRNGPEAAYNIVPTEIEFTNMRVNRFGTLEAKILNKDLDKSIPREIGNKGEDYIVFSTGENLRYYFNYIPKKTERIISSLAINKLIKATRKTLLFQHEL